MAIDIQGLNDNLLKVSKNYDEAVRKWVDLALAPAADIPVEYYDQNGNLIQTTVPNRAKLFNDLLVNVNSAMYRTYYVDAINGNDGNDGSQAAPFKTVKKAIDSVPVGGVGAIRLTEGQTFIIDSIINIVDKNITLISTNGNNKAKIQFAEYITANNTRALYNYILQGVLTFLYVDIAIPPIGDSTIQKDSRYATAILPLYGEKAKLSELNLYWSNLTLDGDYSFIDMTSAGGGSPLISLDTYATNVIVNTTTSKLITLKDIAILRLSVLLTDNTGTGITINDLISGIIRDTNGTPRNVISNIVL